MAKFIIMGNYTAKGLGGFVRILIQIEELQQLH